MWTSKLRSIAPYVGFGIATSGTAYFVIRTFRKGNVLHASAVPVKPFSETHVVIVGGGYGGMNLAQKIKKNCQLTLIDARDHFHHNMGAQRSASEPGYIQKCLIPFKPTFGDSFKQGKVVGIDVTNQTVTLASGEIVHYDDLVIATGTGGRFPSKLPIDISAKEAIEKYEEMVAKVQKAQEIVIIGGGAVGVELSGDIKEDYQDKTVTLIHPREIIVNDRVCQSFQDTVKLRLKTLGVETMLGERVSNLADIRAKGYTDVTVKTDKGNEKKADLVIECTGLKVNNEAYKDSLGDKMDKLGRLKVDQFLGVEGVPNVYAIGDCTSTPEIKLARLAEAQATYMSKNLQAKHEGKQMQLYQMNEGKQFIISAGRSGGAVQMGTWVFGDWLTRTIKGNTVFTPMQWKAMGQEMPK